MPLTHSLPEQNVPLKVPLSLDVAPKQTTAIHPFIKYLLVLDGIGTSQCPGGERAFIYIFIKLWDLINFETECTECLC